jgi:hypothetical protein
VEVRKMRKGSRMDSENRQQNGGSMFKIITADQRLKAKRGVKALVVGPAGVGKTWQLHTLDPARTLFVDLEAGDLSVQDVPVDTVQPKTWQECRDLAAFLAGPNPALEPSFPYSQAHYDAVVERYGGPKALDKYDTYFIDSITVAGRLCFRWSQQQPEAMSERSGKPDVRGAYGLHAREMIAWLTQIQHARAKNVIFVGILEKVVDELNVSSWQLQVEGAKKGRELPGIVDQILTLQFIRFEGDDSLSRAFVCQFSNPYGWPAKDRSGRLDMFEPPDLGEVIRKILREQEQPTEHKLKAV